jgi:Domain of unknown function (DUF1707)
MPGEVQPTNTGNDPTQLRISDAERHQVAEILREAAGEGRLELDELDQRLEATYAARTYADLVPITLDLPGSPSTRPKATGVPYAGPAGRTGSELVVPNGPDHESHVAILGGFERKGGWIVPRELSVFCMMGGADIDLRMAKFAAREVTITVNCFMGGAQITVGPNVHVVMDGTGIMGGYAGPKGDAYQADASSPIVRVKGVAIWGGVSVERKD